MILSTTPDIEGKSIKQYHGIVTGEAILGANIMRDFFAGVRDIVGGRSAAYEKELRHAREVAMNAMTAEARELEANAVLSIDLDYETVGSGMLMVTVTGTAVTLTD